MKNQIQTAIELRDRAVQVALNFVGHHISSSDGSYELLINCIHEAILETDKEGRADEREACARMADELSGERSLGEDIGDAIRARGEAKEGE